MGRGKGFELIPEALPPRRRSDSSFYRQIVEEFIQSKESSVLVSGTDRKPATLMQGLRKTVDKDGLEGVNVAQRGGKVYLSKTAAGKS